VATVQRLLQSGQIIWLKEARARRGQVL